LRIHTRSLELEVSSGVVDVHVNHLATEVTIKEGQARVTTPDGLRQTQMLAGQSARAGDAGGTALAVRLAPGQALQPIEPVVLPAIQPKPAPDGIAAAAPPEASSTAVPSAPPASAPALTPAGAAGAQLLVPRQATATRGARPRPPLPDNPPSAKAAPEQHYADQTLQAARIEGRPTGADRLVGAFAPASRSTDPAAIRRSKFERLTAGVLDGIRPAHPAPSEGRSIR
jgi:hypothetical protein